MKTIFIVDDDEMYQMLLKRVIKKVGAEVDVLSFFNGDLALEAFKSALKAGTGLPNIIFLDINMPVLDGWQFLEEYELLKDKVVLQPDIYMISSSLDDRDKSMALKNTSIKDFLRKPITLQLLQEIILAQ